MKRLTLIFALTLVSSCGDDAGPTTPAIPAAAKKKQVEAAPVAAETEVDYQYAALGKRDPFRSFTEVSKTGTPGGDPGAADTCTEPLCLVDVDELTVVAVVSGDANPLAMVEDRTGVGHIVRRNTRMGKGGGKVTQILRDCIVVLSFVSGGADGKPQPNKQNLCVRQNKDSAPALDLLRNKEFVP